MRQRSTCGPQTSKLTVLVCLVSVGRVGSGGVLPMINLSTNDSRLSTAAARPVSRPMVSTERHHKDKAENVKSAQHIGGGSECIPEET